MYKNMSTCGLSGVTSLSPLARRDALQLMRAFIKCLITLAHKPRARRVLHRVRWYAQWGSDCESVILFLLM